MRVRFLLFLSLLLFAAGLLFQACGGDDKDEEDKLDCRSPLTAWYEECGFAVSFDDRDPASFEEAFDSCQNGYGKMWNLFIHCYLTSYLPAGEDCQAWADCAPDHGFDTDDDDLTDDDLSDDDVVDDDVADDDAADDDVVDDDVVDDDVVDDDVVDDDVVDDDVVDDDVVDDDVVDDDVVDDDIADNDITDNDTAC